MSRHGNKLRIGHLKGNRFEIRVRNPEQDWQARADAIVEKLKAVGMPNYFGPQRFGKFNTNAIDGLHLVRGGSVRVDRRMRKFFLSALQSHVFNTVLNLRIEAGLFDSVVSGDMAQKHDTGGMFLVEDSELETPRAKRLEISATIPLFGKKTHLSIGRAGEFEQNALDYLGMGVDDTNMVRGDRRISRVRFDALDIEPAEDGYVVRFSLPSGAYATCLMRELMKADVDTTGDLGE
jgi:tRNA pseudouridine13 synthase